MVEAVVDFHEELYPAEALARAADAYAGFAEVALERRGAYSRATIRSDAPISSEALGHEFANFALAACAAHASDGAP